VVEPDREKLARGAAELHELGVAPEPAKSMPRLEKLPATGEHVVPRIPRDGGRDRRRYSGAFLAGQAKDGLALEVADPVARQAVVQVPTGVVEERVAEADVAARALEVVVAEDSPRVEDVEAGREGRSKSQGSVKLSVPAFRRPRRGTASRPPSAPRKFRCDRSTVPTKLSADE